MVNGGARTAWLRSRWWRRRLAILGLVSLAIFVMAPLGFYIAERNANANIGGVFDSYKWLGQTLLEGGSPFDAETPGGYAVYYLVGLTAVAVVASLTAAVTSRFVSTVLLRGSGMADATQRNHIIICGWSSKGPEILRELHAEEVRDKRPVVVLADREEFTVKDNLVTFVRGKPTDTEDLLRAGLDRASVAIILADASDAEAHGDEIDAKTLLTTLAVESVNPACYTCVEVLKSQNRVHFQRTKADELVVSAELTGALLAGSASTPGLSRLVSDLVTHPEGTEFYRVRPPADLVGLPFVDALRVMKDKHDALLIAVFNDGGYTVNPDKTHTIDAADEVLVIANSVAAMAL